MGSAQADIPSWDDVVARAPEDASIDPKLELIYEHARARDDRKAEIGLSVVARGLPPEGGGVAAAAAAPGRDARRLRPRLVVKTQPQAARSPAAQQAAPPTPGDETPYRFALRVSVLPDPAGRRASLADVLSGVPGLIGVTAAPGGRPTLDYSVAEIEALGARHAPRPDEATVPGAGRGVIVGIVDYGCDFAHPNFRDAAGRTRLLLLWDQNSLATEAIAGGPKAAPVAVDADDRGKLYLASGACTLAPPPARAAGNGFWFVVQNAAPAGAAVRVAPHGAAPIDGGATREVPAGQSLVVASNGAEYRCFPYRALDRDPADPDDGRMFDRAAIDAALAQDFTEPYAVLGYDPHMNDYTGERWDRVEAAHGTHVMDIAAGNGAATGHPGVAPEADLVFVHCRAPNGFAALSTNDLVAGAAFVFDAAAKASPPRPAVVNVSMNYNSGSHDGSNEWETGLDHLLPGDSAPARAIVVSAGNSYALDWHASGALAAGAAATLKWRIEPADPSLNSIEVYYEAASDVLEASLLAPAAPRAVALGGGRRSARLAGEAGLRALLAHAPAPSGSVRRLQVLVQPGDPGGEWTLVLKNPAPAPMPFHAWIERDGIVGDAKPSRFVAGAPQPGVVVPDPRCTLGSFACGHRTIAVSAYYAVRGDRPLFMSSSAGPTRDGRAKPQVSAPGDWIHAARSKSGASPPGHDPRPPRPASIAMRGTSMAAPHVSGVLALLMEKRPGATLAELHAALVAGARGDPPHAPPGPGAQLPWDERYGYGRVSARRALDAL